MVWYNEARKASCERIGGHDESLKKEGVFLSDKKSLGCFLYALFSICVLALMVVAYIFFSTDNGWGAMWASFSWLILIVIWIVVSAVISKKQQARLPVLQVNAVLVEKIQETHRHSTDYFLYFELDDRSRKSFKVARDVYVCFSKNQKGLLSYKCRDPKRETFLSNIFVRFEI